MSAFSQRLRFQAPTVGGDYNVWGDEINTNFGLLDDAIAGIATISAAGQSTITLTANQGASDQARCAGVILNGELTENLIVYVPSEQKFTWFQNNTTGNYTVTISTSAGGNSCTIPQATTSSNNGWSVVFCDGTNTVAISQDLIDKFPEVSTPSAMTQEQFTQLASIINASGSVTPSRIDIPGQDSNATTSIWNDTNGNNYFGPPNNATRVDKTGNFLVNGNSSAIGSVVAGTGLFANNTTPICPVGTIVLWAGNSSNVPTGWAICNGQNGTVNMTGMVPIGPNGDGQVGQTTGSNDVDVSTTDITTTTNGQHTHNITVQNAGQHNHTGATGSYTLQVEDIPQHTHGIYGAEFSVGSGSGNYYALGTSNNSIYTNTTDGGGTGGSHTHAISEDGTHTHAASNDDQGNHTHTLTGTVSVVQPSVYVYYIQRVA